MKTQLMLTFVILLSATALFAADKKSDCTTYVRLNANKAVDAKVKEFEKSKAKYSRELIFADVKKQMFDDCMKKK